MPRRPEHPLHVTLTGWGQWARAGRHDPQGWYSTSPQAPERASGGEVPQPCSRPPNLRPGPPLSWQRIDIAVWRLSRQDAARQPMDAIIRYYVFCNIPWCEHCRRGADMVQGALAIFDTDE